MERTTTIRASLRDVERTLLAGAEDLDIDFAADVLARLGRQHGAPIGFRLAVEQLFADRRDDLHIDAGTRQPWQHAHEIERRTRALRHHVTMSRLAWREIANDVQPFRRRAGVRVRELAAIRHRA